MGQVLFPSQALSQVQSLIEAGCLFQTDATPEDKRRAIFDLLKYSFLSYPDSRAHLFTIVYITRSSSGMDAVFWVFTLTWDGKEWKEDTPVVPTTSSIIRAWGSGKTAIERWDQRWRKTQQGGRTSRSVFSAFCDALANGEDQFTGGAPQLAGLYRKDRGIIFGVIYNGARHFLGLPVTDHALVSMVEWRNPLFERCDGRTMTRLDAAQQHPRPQGLGKAL